MKSVWVHSQAFVQPGSLGPEVGDLARQANGGPEQKSLPHPHLPQVTFSKEWKLCPGSPGDGAAGQLAFVLQVPWSSSICLCWDWLCVSGL